MHRYGISGKAYLSNMKIALPKGIKNERKLTVSNIAVFLFKTKKEKINPITKNDNPSQLINEGIIPHNKTIQPFWLP